MQGAPSRYTRAPDIPGIPRNVRFIQYDLHRRHYITNMSIYRCDMDRTLDSLNMWKSRDKLNMAVKGGPYGPPKSRTMVPHLSLHCPKSCVGAVSRPA